jgi:hypothetical protein
VNHYCTYFDSRYLVPGVALMLSLRRHDPGMTLWVLAVDELTAAAIKALGGDDVRVLSLADLEQTDPELALSRATRSPLENLFTLSPCLPRHLLRSNPEIPAITYVDADLWFFDRVDEMHREWDGGSIYLVRHDMPDYLRAREGCFGRFNVGVLGFRNDSSARACLDWWRERCLEWCKDVPEPGRYADQKYLDGWPERFNGVVVSQHPGINVAPWNWQTRQLAANGAQATAGGRPLVVFHFAQLRRLGWRWIDTNQSEFGVMPFSLRAPIYGSYVEALDEAERELSGAAPTNAARPRSRRRGWQHWAIALLFGTIWVRWGRWWFSTGWGLGRCSGRFLAWQRRLRGRTAI